MANLQRVVQMTLLGSIPKGQTDLTFKRDFSDILRREAFAILATFYRTILSCLEAEKSV